MFFSRNDREYFFSTFLVSFEPLLFISLYRFSRPSQKDAESTYQDMIDEYQNKFSQYQSKSASWTAAVKESKEKELMQIQTNIQEFQQSITQELQAKQNELMAPLYDKAQEAVNKVAKAQGIAVVFDSGSALYFDDALTVDLTKAARKEIGIPDDRTLEGLAEQLSAQQQ